MKVQNGGGLATMTPMERANFSYDHPKGSIYGCLGPQGLAALTLPHANRTKPTLVMDEFHPDAVTLETALNQYFSGSREAFMNIPLDLSAGTAFQQSVWQEACKVAWGDTRSYGALTASLGKKPGTARAVGAALGANPIAILVPCHRFIAQDGGLVNFAAGLAWKQDLLQLEGSILC